MVLLGVVLAGSLAGGFLVGPSGFGVNLLAGVVGLVVAIVAGILFLDRLPDRGRERAWRHVRQQTFEVLHGHIIAFAIRCWLDGGLGVSLRQELFVPLSDDEPQPSSIAIDSLRSLATEIRIVGPRGALPTKQILDAARWDLGQITDVVTPTVISLSSGTVLVERLVKLSRSVSRAQLALYLEDSQARPGSDYAGTIAWQPIAETLEAAAEVFERMTARPA
jgi:hypothetical protein